MKRLCTLALAAPFALTATAAAADNAELAGHVAATEQRFADAWVAGDVDGFLELFTDDAVYWPFTGGQYQGTEEIRGYLEQAPVPEEAEVAGTFIERLEDDVVVSTGSFRLTMPGSGNGDLRGEYVVIVEEEDDGVAISHIMGFPERAVPGELQ